MSQHTKIDLAAAHPPLSKALEQQAELKSQLLETEDEIQRIQRLSKEGQRRSPIDEDAARLLAGEEAAPFDLEELTNEREALYRQRLVLTRSIEMAKRRVQEETATASRIVCERLVPEHRAIVSGVAKALIGLGRALEDERKFCENLNDSGVIFIGYLRPMPVLGMGTDSNSRPAAWFKDAIENKLIDVGFIPPDWREKWSVKSWLRSKAA